MSYSIRNEDCLLTMARMDSNSVDAIVTDPPYGLSFMGKDWDHGVPGLHFWIDALRVAKPGCHLLAFGGTRTFHRLAVAIEDAGWEIRDTLMWVYGSGFPKSHDVSKAIDKDAGIVREDKFEGSFERHAGPTGNKKCDKCGKWLVSGSPCICPRPQDVAQSPMAKQWSGWGTALKPAWEPIIMARKPLEGTVAQNVQKYGTGALNIDGCRIEGAKGNGVWGSSNKNVNPERTFVGSPNAAEYRTEQNALGRWPANLIHDGSEEVVEGFPVTGASNIRPPTGKPLCATSGKPMVWNANSVMDTTIRGVSDGGGSASRFFYCAKASRSERNRGLEGMEEKRSEYRPNDPDENSIRTRLHGSRSNVNHHPTVKPLALMAYLVKLVTPPNGLVYDPFTGSGTTGMACLKGGYRFIGSEIESEYCAIATRRIQFIVEETVAKDGLFADPHSV